MAAPSPAGPLPITTTSNCSMGRDDTESARVHYHTYMKLSAALSLALTCLAPAVAAGEWVERVEDGIMGTRIAVELWAEDPAQGRTAIDAVLAEMRRVDQAMSTYKPTSEVSIVNAQAAKAPVKISAELFDLLKTALDYSRATDGAFDITYASVGYLYDYRQRVHPGAEEIKAALPGVNYRHIVLDPAQHTVRYSQAGVRI